MNLARVIGKNSPIIFSDVKKVSADTKAFLFGSKQIANILSFHSINNLFGCVPFATANIQNFLLLNFQRVNFFYNFRNYIKPIFTMASDIDIFIYS